MILFCLCMYTVAYLGFHFGGYLHGASRHAARGSFDRGVQGHAPPRNSLKMVQFGAF